MKLDSKRIILTGAAGGLGRQLASLLDERHARCALIDANAAALDEIAGRLSGAHAITADLASRDGCDTAAENAAGLLGGVDILINLAGLMSFQPFESEDIERVERLLRVNLVAPMRLTRAVLPAMLAQGSGRIVNVGSMFGSIGFACYSAYSASKFGLRGFSESLRRELADTPIDITYIAPRAVKTPINTSAIVQANLATGTRMDEPEKAAAGILRAIRSGRREAYLGFPESLFARLNGIWPALIDAGTRSQNRIARGFAEGRGEPGVTDR